MARLRRKGISPFVKFLLFAIVFGGIAVLYLKFKDQIAPKGKGTTTVAVEKIKGVKPIKVCVVTWGGYAGGQYYNGGFEASTRSRYYQEKGILVQFVVIDDYQASRDAWKAGEVDLLWNTADAFPVEAGNMAPYKPKIVFQADWSRGGDVVVATRQIKSVADLRGGKVAVAFGTPSHTFLLWMLQAGGMDYQDIQPIEAPSAIDAATYFKAGRVDAAVVWSPDDQDCLSKVSGSHILKSTKDASNIIADIFYAKEDFIKTHQKELKALVEGWLIGAAEINSDPEAKEEAVKILAVGLNQPEEFIRTAINNVRLCTYGDNVNFFNLHGDYTGVTGEDLYTKTGELYRQINMVTSDLPAWRLVTDTSILRSINLSGPMQAAEVTKKFTKVTREIASAPAFSTKALTVNFQTGSAVLDENSKTIIDIGFTDIAKTFANSRIRIEGNTDNTGSYEVNRALSLRRAKAVANYLVEEYGFDPNRFVIVGNGPDKPIADNSTDGGRAKNRRTDFQLLSE